MVTQWQAELMSGKILRPLGRLAAVTPGPGWGNIEGLHNTICTPTQEAKMLEMHLHASKSLLLIARSRPPRIAKELLEALDDRLQSSLADSPRCGARPSTTSLEPRSQPREADSRVNIETRPAATLHREKALADGKLRGTSYQQLAPAAAQQETEH